jgi:stearoyl-CoA desaturase (Delta-9 desaturase)
VIGLLALGEGWHNNHHAFPRPAFLGLRWWQLDVSGYLIWSLERLGLVAEVYRVPSALMRRQTASSSVTDAVPTGEESVASVAAKLERVGSFAAAARRGGERAGRSGAYGRKAG